MAVVSVAKESALQIAKSLGQSGRADAIERGRGVFVALASRLSPENKALRNADLAFLLGLAEYLKAGYSADDAMALAANAPPPVETRGKRSPEFKNKYLERNGLLRQAFNLREGTTWGRCTRIANDVSDYCNRIKSGNPPVATNEYDRLILALCDFEGLNPLITATGVRWALGMHKPETEGISKRVLNEKKKSNS